MLRDNTLETGVGNHLSETVGLEIVAPKSAESCPNNPSHGVKLFSIPSRDTGAGIWRSNLYVVLRIFGKFLLFSSQKLNNLVLRQKNRI